MSANGDALAAIVSFRVGAKLTLAQIVPFLNNGLSLIEGAGSYMWDLVYNDPISIATDHTYQLTPDVDVGKEMAFFNINGLPIVKMNIGEAWFSSKNPTGGYAWWNGWFIDNGGTAPGIVRFLPQPPQLRPTNTATMFYHQLSPILITGGGGPTTPWEEGWLDDLVVDYAEGEIKRILNWVGWQDIQKRFVDRLQDVKTIFSTQRENMGPVFEVQQVQAEKQSGRS